MSVRVDLHCHTTASHDGGLTELHIRSMLHSGLLQSIAITDHNRIDEAQRLHSLLGDIIIVGEEVMTTDGEIIGLYLQTPISSGLSPLETVTAIKEQRGIVLIPHPFETVRSGITRSSLDQIKEYVDLIEVNNGRSFSKSAQKQANAWASDNNVAAVACSDTHGVYGWGRVATELTQLPTKGTLVNLCVTSTLIGNKNGYLNYGYPKVNKIKKFFKRLRG